MQTILVRIPCLLTALAVTMFLASLAACAPVTLPSADFQAASSRPDSEVKVIVSDQRAVVEVWSDSGIGAATLQLQSGALPDEIVIRLYLAGLEQFQFTYADVIVTASVSASSEQPVLQSVTVGTAAPSPITADSPYWLQISYAPPSSVSGDDAGYFDVAAPPAFFASGESAFDIAWIDFYR